VTRGTTPRGRDPACVYLSMYVCMYCSFVYDIVTSSTSPGERNLHVCMCCVCMCAYVDVKRDGTCVDTNVCIHVCWFVITRQKKPRFCLYVCMNPCSIRGILCVRVHVVGTCPKATCAHETNKEEKRQTEKVTSRKNNILSIRSSQIVSCFLTKICGNKHTNKQKHAQ
jgi:hypothetical protein